MKKRYEVNYSRFKQSQLEDPSHVKEIISIGVKQFLGLHTIPMEENRNLSDKYENQGNCSPEMMEFLISCKILVTGENKKNKN